MVLFEFLWPATTFVLLFLAHDCTWQVKASAWVVLSPFILEACGEWLGWSLTHMFWWRQRFWMAFLGIKWWQYNCTYGIIYSLYVLFCWTLLAATFGGFWALGKCQVLGFFLWLTWGPCLKPILWCVGLLTDPANLARSFTRIRYRPETFNDETLGLDLDIFTGIVPWKNPQTISTNGDFSMKHGDWRFKPMAWGSFRKPVGSHWPYQVFIEGSASKWWDFLGLQPCQIRLSEAWGMAQIWSLFRGTWWFYPWPTLGYAIFTKTQILLQLSSQSLGWFSFLFIGLG